MAAKANGEIELCARIIIKTVAGLVQNSPGKNGMYRAKRFYCIKINASCRVDIQDGFGSDSTNKPAGVGAFKLAEIRDPARPWALFCDYHHRVNCAFSGTRVLSVRYFRWVFTARFAGELRFFSYPFTRALISSPRWIYSNEIRLK